MEYRNIKYPVIWKPSFPLLEKKLQSVQDELQYLNKTVIPFMRSHGYDAKSGRMSWTEVKRAATCKEVCPEVEKRSLQYEEFFSFTGYAVSFKEDLFMKWYDSTEEGQERLFVLECAEECPKSFISYCLTKNITK